MSADSWLMLATCLLGIITTVMLAAIPWGYSVGQRMARIETELRHFSPTDVMERIKGVEVELSSSTASLSREIRHVSNAVSRLAGRSHDQRTADEDRGM